MFFLATADAHGRPTAPTRAATPGFVRVLDARRSRSPATTATACSSRWATSLVNPEVGLLFIDFERRRGCASTAPRPISPTTRCSSLARAQLVVRVTRARGLPQLPALHPPVRAGRAFALRPAHGGGAAGAGLDAHRLGARRAAGELVVRGAPLNVNGWLGREGVRDGFRRPRAREERRHRRSSAWSRGSSMAAGPGAARSTKFGDFVDLGHATGVDIDESHRPRGKRRSWPTEARRRRRNPPDPPLPSSPLTFAGHAAPRPGRRTVRPRRARSRCAAPRVSRSPRRPARS